jgi:hypothetical protein
MSTLSADRKLEGASQLAEKPRTRTALSISELQDATLSAISILRDEIQGIIDAQEDKGPFALTLLNLIYYMSGRSQAVTMLASWGFPWDAEIVLRSFYESCIKILFLSLSPTSDRERLAGC